MKKLAKKYRLMIICLIISLFFTSCGDPFSSSDDEKSGEKEIHIESVDWVMENIDPSFWSSGAKPSACISFWIYFKEQDIEPEDILSVKITNPTNRVWTDDTSDKIKENLNTENNYYGGWDRKYSTYYSSNGSVLPIGTYTVEIELVNGNSDTLEFTVTAPGSTTNNNFEYAYTEDFSGSLTSSTPLLSRADISSASLNTGKTDLEIKFSVNDSNVYNGYIWLYDTNNNYIGYTTYFRSSTGTISSIINSGSSILNDGSINTVNVNANNIKFEDNKTLANLGYIRINLKDGKQYPSTNNYNAVSRSKSFTVTVN